MATRICQWNANGLLSRQSEFKQHLANNAYDVICIQETFLKPQKRFSVQGCDVIRSDRIGVKSGLVTLVRHGIKYISLASPQNIESQIVEIPQQMGNWRS